MKDINNKNKNYFPFSNWESIQKLAQQELEYQAWKWNVMVSSLDMWGITLFNDFEDLPNSHKKRNPL